jgi:hypothetical protein
MANGDAYVGMIALSGLVGWGLSVLVIRVWPALNGNPMPMGRIDTEAAIGQLFAWFQFLRGDLAGPHLV